MIGYSGFISRKLIKWFLSVILMSCKEAAREAYDSNPIKKREAARKAYNAISKYNQRIVVHSYISYAGVTVQQWT